MSSAGPQQFSDAERAAIHSRRDDQDRTLAAMHELEAALSSAAPGRQEGWRHDVLATLEVLEAATKDEARNAERPDSLLSDIARTQPRLRNRVRALRLQYRQLCDVLLSVRNELDEEHGEQPIDYADLRQRLGWTLTALRHQRARESDLIYEAYYEAFHTDLRAETASDDNCP